MKWLYASSTLSSMTFLAVVINPAVEQHRCVLIQQVPLAGIG
jgi:hypothetical protein